MKSQGSYLGGRSPRLGRLRRVHPLGLVGAVAVFTVLSLLGSPSLASVHAALPAGPRIDAANSIVERLKEPRQLPAKRTDWDVPHGRRATPLTVFTYRLLRLAEQLSERLDVPYVWGGATIGTPAACSECRRCITTRRVGVPGRVKLCPACKSCGVDCSHFAQRLLASSGLAFPYAATGKLVATGREKLAASFGLVDLGRDLASARPGDLLLYRRHVVVLLSPPVNGRGDIIHSTRGRRPGDPGGIQLRRGLDLRRFRGPLLKILRHRDLVAPASELLGTQSPPLAGWPRQAAATAQRRDGESRHAR
jgi:hypothetical protein